LAQAHFGPYSDVPLPWGSQPRRVCTRSSVQMGGCGSHACQKADAAPSAPVHQHAAEQPPRRGPPDGDPEKTLLLSRPRAAKKAGAAAGTSGPPSLPIPSKAAEKTSQTGKNQGGKKAAAVPVPELQLREVDPPPNDVFVPDPASEAMLESIDGPLLRPPVSMPGPDSLEEPVLAASSSDSAPPPPPTSTERLWSEAARRQPQARGDLDEADAGNGAPAAATVIGAAPATVAAEVPERYGLAPLDDWPQIERSEALDGGVTPMPSSAAFGSWCNFCQV